MNDKNRPARPNGDTTIAASAKNEDAVPPALTIHTPVDVRSASLAILAALGILFVLHAAQSVLIPIVLGILISYALAPFVGSLARHRVPRGIGAAIAVILLVGAIGTGIYTLTDEAMAFVAAVPEAAQKIRARVAHHGRRDTAFEQVQRAANEIERTAQEATQTDRGNATGGPMRVQVVEPTFKASDYLWMGGVGLVGFFAQFFVILFLAYFFLVTGDLYKRKLVKIAGPRLSQKRITVQILDDINKQIESFIKVQVITSVLVGVATGAALWWFGLEQYAIWGLLAGVLNTIPYLGPVVMTGGLAIVAFLQFDDLLRTAYICGVAFLITSLEGFLLTPALMGRAARMNPVAIFVGLLFWGWLWGAWGAVLAVPMLMMLKAICDHVEDLQPIGELLGE